MIKNVKKLIEEFIKNKVKYSDIVYNEFSLQHELGFYLRSKLSKNWRVDFERNIAEFEKNNSPLQIKKPIKKEIDIIIRPTKIFDIKDIIAIELKYPRNGAFPKTMWQFKEDIDFLNQLVEEGFKKAYALTIVEQTPFYKGKFKQKPYTYFRSFNTTKNGNIINNDNAIIKWKKINDNQLDKKHKQCVRMYYLKEINPEETC